MRFESNAEASKTAFRPESTHPWRAMCLKRCLRSVALARLRSPIYGRKLELVLAAYVLSIRQFTRLGRNRLNFATLASTINTPRLPGAQR